MGEVTLLSLLVGSLGLQAVAAGGWLRWQQLEFQQACEEEEETLTPYQSDDTVKATHPSTRQNGSAKPPKDPRLVGWEFKIVRSHQDIFRDPAVFQRLCEEESQSGWILLEKLDDRRIRFKRPIALREIVKGELLAIDPYRSYYGTSRNLGGWVAAIASLILLILPAYLGFMLVSTTLNKQPSNLTSPNQKGALTSPETQK